MADISILLEFYAHNYYECINDSEKVKNIASYLNVCLYSGKLFRSTDYSPFLEVKEGDIISYPNRLSSWTNRYSIADQYYDESKRIIMVWEASSVNGKDITHYSDWNESEVLCSIDLSLRVTKREGELVTVVKV
jgi:hypothetical protein